MAGQAQGEVMSKNKIDGVDYNTFGFLARLGQAEGVIRRELAGARSDLYTAWYILDDNSTPEDRGRACVLIRSAIEQIDKLTGDNTQLFSKSEQS